MSGGIASAQLPHSPLWPSKRARFLFSERREKARPEDIQLTASQGYGVISQELYQHLSGNRVTAALAGTENFLHVCIGDYVISLRTFEGGIEYAFEDGCISPAYTILKACPEVDAGFFRYMLKSSAFLSVLQTAVSGIRDGKSVKFKDFAELVLPLPDLLTQERIAAFLDRETARIDQLIEKKQRLMEVLHEKRRVAAIQCLSSGLEDYSWNQSEQSLVFRFEHSGWRTQSVKQIVSFMTSGSRGWSSLLRTEGELFIQSGNIGRQMDIDIQSAQRVQPQTGAEADRTLIAGGDVLVCITGGRTGAVGYVEQVSERAYINQHICLLRARQNLILPRLLAHILWSEIGQKQFEMLQYGVKQGLGFNQVAKLRLPIPPRDQQENILADLDAMVSRIDTTVAKIAESVHRFAELRSSLITAAVTGQIDVDAWRKRGNTDRHLEAIAEEASI